MFDQLVQAISDYPYLGPALVLILCGLGLPLPEELILIASGYVSAKFPDQVHLHWMMVWCAGAILGGDLIPYTLGRVFGTRVLRLRPLRLIVTKNRLARFDRWFRRRGDMVIFIARFVPGIRVVAFFTAGTMRMGLVRFLMLDTLGIGLCVPALTFLGHRGAGVIDEVIAKVQQVERGILWAAITTAVLLGVWMWLARRRRVRLRRLATPAETFVEPQVPTPPAEPKDAPPAEPADGDGAPPPAS